MYWGNVSPSQDEPNQGDPTGNVNYPLWYAPNAILMSSAKRENGNVVRGIFDVEIDPASLSFRSIRTFAFPYLIRNFDFNPSAGEFLVTFSLSASNAQVVRCVAAEPILAVVDTLLDESWLPRRARFAGPGGPVIAYATDPATTEAGFYSLSDGATGDSLLLAIDLSIRDALGFDAGAGKLVFGVTKLTNGAPSTELFLLELGGNNVAQSIANLPRAFVSADIDPIGARAVVCTWDGYADPPGSTVYVVDLVSGQFVPVAVRTYPVGFVLASFASWSPQDQGFAFSAGGFSGEGDVFPRELWVKKVVPTP